ncbi:MAG: hypothetical protein O3A00_26825 [Planctomycetota bacterium]|nr:hypothetical protein [Planctomycetota bacterium]
MSRAIQNAGSGVDRQQTLSQLSRQIRGMERSTVHKQQRLHDAPTAISTGINALDQTLPDGGILPGSVWECLAVGDGSGAGTISLAVAAHVMRRHASQGELVIVDRHREVYPPALASWRIALERTVVVQPGDSREALWALEQAMRCRGVAVTIGWIDQMANHAYRRLQLAAQRGGGVGLLIRSARFRRSTCWADARLLVSGRSRTMSHESRVQFPSKDCRLETTQDAPGFRRLTLDLISYGHGSLARPSIEVELDDHTGTVREVPRLAGAARAG